jgi:outer membrane protein assembly factor BamB
VAVNPDLTVKWAASLRDRLRDGCGVMLPPNGTRGGCREGTAIGVDPTTNQLPAGQVIDQSTASPTITPDGSILLGVLTAYNSFRGHLMKFSAAGDFLAASDFGWDNTPAIYPHDGTYSVVLKDNHYGAQSYCGVEQYCARDEERYELVSLDANLQREWGFLSTNNQACERQPDGTLRCFPHSSGFEWCVNMVAIDKDGTIYANSEDGNLYAIDRRGNLAGSVFLRVAIGAAYTPLAIGPDGLIYTQNAGSLFVAGSRSVRQGNTSLSGVARGLVESMFTHVFPDRGR